MGLSKLTKSIASLAIPLSSELTQVAGKLSMVATNLDRMLNGITNGLGNDQVRVEAQKLAFITILQSAIEKASSSQRFFAETAINDLWTRLSTLREPNNPGNSSAFHSMLQSQKEMMEALTTIMNKSNSAMKSVVNNLR